MSKSLAFFDGGQVVELPTPIFGRIKSKRRGQRRAHERYFPNGECIPSRKELLEFITQHVLYQIDESLDGPIFCKHVIKEQRERNRDSMFHVVLGPHRWTGVWEIVGNRRMFDVRALYLVEENRWLPQMILSPGNYVGVDNLNGIELDPVSLRREMILRGFVTGEEFDRYANPSTSRRYRAIATAVRGIWM